MSLRLAQAVLGAAGLAGSAMLLFGLLTGHVVLDGDGAARARQRLRSVLTVRLLAGLMAGVVVLVVTSWVPVAAGVLLAVVAWPRLFGGAASQQQRIEQLEDLAVWVESLRDTISRGRGLPEVVMATAASAPPSLRRPLADLVARMQAREPLDSALLVLADDLDDVVADQVIAALTLNARTSSAKLAAVLGALAAATRRQVDVRRTVEAERAAPRRGVKIIMVVTVGLLVGFALLSPGYLEPFQDFTGQLVLTLSVVCFGAGFLVLRSLANFQAPTRFLATPGVRSRVAAAQQSSQSSVAQTLLGSVAVR